jgi:GNAT superfamily N-acetyltransferase
MTAGILIRSYTLADLAGLIAIQRDCFPPPFPPELWWTSEQIASHVRLFPEGALCAVDVASGELVGSATAHIVRFDPAHPAHTWSKISADGWLTNHSPAGDTLYGVDVGVRPAWRGRGVAKAFYQARFALVRRLGLARFQCGSRLSGYHRYADTLTPEAYADAVVAGRLVDPVVTPQLKTGMRPVTVVRGYLSDAESSDNALLMEWRNPELPLVAR